jgi:hypothetical protein
MVKWTNAAGDYNAKNPKNWESGIMPQTIQEWAEATAHVTGGGYHWPRPISVWTPIPPASAASDDHTPCTGSSESGP